MSCQITLDIVSSHTSFSLPQPLNDSSLLCTYLHEVSSMPLLFANGALRLRIALPDLQEHAQEARLGLCLSLKVPSQKGGYRSVESCLVSPCRDFTAAIPYLPDGYVSQHAYRFLQHVLSGKCALRHRLLWFDTTVIPKEGGRPSQVEETA